MGANPREELEERVEHWVAAARGREQIREGAFDSELSGVRDPDA